MRTDYMRLFLLCCFIYSCLFLCSLPETLDYSSWPLASGDRVARVEEACHRDILNREISSFDNYATNVWLCVIDVMCGLSVIDLILYSTMHANPYRFILCVLSLLTWAELQRLINDDYRSKCMQ